jgi:hypothetical protein
VPAVNSKRCFATSAICIRRSGCGNDDKSTRRN